MTRSQLGLPVLVCPGIAPFQDALQLFIGPSIEIDRLDSADVCSHTAVDTGASNANKHTEIPTGPSRVLVSFTVCAHLISL